MIIRLAFGALAGFLMAHIMLTLMPLALGFTFDVSSFLGSSILKLPHIYIYWAYLGLIGSIGWARNTSFRPKRAISGA